MVAKGHEAMRDAIIKNGLGPQEHFKRCCKVLFPKYVWHDFSERMLDLACTSRYGAVAGCSHVGKSYFIAPWAIINYLSWPNETLVLITSTTIRDAKKRVWGTVQTMWNSVPGLPGKIVDSPTPGIRYVDKQGNASEHRGIYLIPSEAKKSAEISSKTQGMKSERLFLLGDEFSELSEALLTAAMSNLANNTYFNMQVYANPKSMFDPFGKFARPVGGWSGLNVETEEWETELGGVGIHLDALKSPNWLAQSNVAPILKFERIQEAIDRLGQNSPEFWRMFRGWFCPTGDVNAIYSELDLERFEAYKPAVWGNTKTPIAAVDPSFSSEGDRTILTLGNYGVDENQKPILEFVKSIHLQEDVTNKTESRDFQIAKQIITICKEHNVQPHNFAYDATGAGAPFGSILKQLWSPMIHPVVFGGAATQVPSPIHDGKKGSEVYANRVSEIWYAGVEYLRGGQFRGIGQALAKEMTSRTYSYNGIGGKLLVQPKREMRALGLPSPDQADSFFILLCLVREKLRGTLAGYNNSKFDRKQKWRERIRQANAEWAPDRAYAHAE